MAMRFQTEIPNQDSLGLARCLDNIHVVYVDYSTYVGLGIANVFDGHFSVNYWLLPRHES
jgi:hypothetical protein